MCIAHTAIVNRTKEHPLIRGIVQFVARDVVKSKIPVYKEVSGVVIGSSSILRERNLKLHKITNRINGICAHMAGRIQPASRSRAKIKPPSIQAITNAHKISWDRVRPAVQYTYTRSQVPIRQNILRRKVEDVSRKSRI